MKVVGHMDPSADLLFEEYIEIEGLCSVGLDLVCMQRFSQTLAMLLF